MMKKALIFIIVLSWLAITGGLLVLLSQKPKPSTLLNNQSEWNSVVEEDATDNNSYKFITFNYKTQPISIMIRTQSHQITETEAICENYDDCQFTIPTIEYMYNPDEFHKLNTGIPLFISKLGGTLESLDEEGIAQLKAGPLKATNSYYAYTIKDNRLVNQISFNTQITKEISYQIDGNFSEERLAIIKKKIEETINSME